jgi:hypothetical protein
VLVVQACEVIHSNQQGNLWSSRSLADLKNGPLTHLPSGNSWPTPAWLVLAMIGACTHSTENDVEGESQGIRLFTRPVFDDEPIVPGCFVGGLLNGRLAPSVDGFGTAMFALPTPSMGAMLMCARRFLEREP